MSDCVRWMTRNDTVTPANSSGCNSFPSPSPSTGTTGTGTPNPASFTVQQATALFWKVKNWTLASSAILTGSGGTPNAFTNGVMTPNAANPTTVSQLYDQTFPTHEWSTGTGGVNLFDITMGACTDWVNSSLTGVWPRLVMTASGLVDLDGSAFCPFAFDKTTLGTPKGPMGGTITLVANDVSYAIVTDLYYDDSAIIAAGASFTPGAWSLTGTDYWPFASLAAATPIYSTSSGISLQPPTN